MGVTVRLSIAELRLFGQNGSCNPSTSTELRFSIAYIPVGATVPRVRFQEGLEMVQFYAYMKTSFFDIFETKYIY